MIRPRLVPTVALSLALLLVGGSLVAGCSSNGAAAASGDDAIVVNGVALSHQDLQDRVRAIEADPAYRTKAFAAGSTSGTDAAAPGTSGGIAAGLVQQVLAQQISFVLAHQEVARRHLTVDDTARERARQLLVAQLTTASTPGGGQPPVDDGSGQEALDDLGPVKDAIVDGLAEIVVLQADMTKQLLTDRALRSAFDADPARFGNQACVSLITIFANKDSTTGSPRPPTDDQYPLALARAEDVRARLDAGGDFATLAQARSDDETTGPQGGDLGCLPLGAYRQKQPEIDTAISLEPVGQVIGPIRTGFGYALLLVRKRGALTFPEAEPQLQADVPSVMQQAYSAWTASAARSAQVQLDPRYGTWSADSGSIEAPS